MEESRKSADEAAKNNDSASGVPNKKVTEGEGREGCANCRGWSRINANGGVGGLGVVADGRGIDERNMERYVGYDKNRGAGVFNVPRFFSFEVKRYSTSRKHRLDDPMKLNRLDDSAIPSIERVE